MSPHRLPFDQSQQEEFLTVFVPGWGFDGRILKLVQPPLPWLSLAGMPDPATFEDELLHFLNREGRPRVRLVGWSMGAHLALEFARHHPERVAELHLLAIRRERPPEEIEAIRREFRRDPQEFLASFYRKCFLGDRRHYQRFQAELEEDYLRAPDLERLHRGLDFLAARTETRPAPVRTHLVHGCRDIIVPLEERAVLPGADSELVEHAGHLVFLSPDYSLLGRERKNIIRRRFSQAADTYDRHALVQKEVAGLLAARLPPPPKDSVLELGCGTGSYTRLLVEHYPEADLLALDFSPAMLETAARNLAGAPQVRFCCEDAETFLAETTERFALVTSNATCQWLLDLGKAFAHISRLLTNGGEFLGSIFGPATLAELGEGLGFLFERPWPLPSSRFLPATVLEDLAGRSFSAFRLEEVNIVRRYRSLSELLHHIKNTGTAGWQEAPPPVFTPRRLRKLDDWFANRYGGYQVTYQIFLLQGRNE